MLRSREKDYPKQVLLFHLNKNDYREIKIFANKGSLLYLNIMSGMWCPEGVLLKNVNVLWQY